MSINRLKFIPTNRANPCPICSDTTGDCRYTNNEVQILCHDNIDFDPNHPDWHYLKPSSNGVWGVFVPRRDEKFDRDAWDRQRRERELLEKQRREKYAQESLPVEARDKAIRKLHRYWGLTTSDRNSLSERGLTEEQIEKGLFFSILPDHDLPPNFPLNFPGMSRDGRRLTVSQRGIASPVFNQERKAIAIQVRYETESNKYRWLSNKDYQTHLPNGELPVTVIKPQENEHTDKVFLSEGILKPNVAAHRLKAKFLGASGGHFSGSPEQVKFSLEDETIRLLKEVWGRGKGERKILIPNPLTFTLYPACRASLTLYPLTFTPHSTKIYRT